LTAIRGIRQALWVTDRACACQRCTRRLSTDRSGIRIHRQRYGHRRQTTRPGRRNRLANTRRQSEHLGRVPRATWPVQSIGMPSLGCWWRWWQRPLLLGSAAVVETSTLAEWPCKKCRKLFCCGNRTFCLKLKSLAFNYFCR
jgi:hypothetical protein